MKIEYIVFTTTGIITILILVMMANGFLNGEPEIVCKDYGLEPVFQSRCTFRLCKVQFIGCR